MPYLQIKNQGNNNTFISTADVTFTWGDVSRRGGAGLDGAGLRAPYEVAFETIKSMIETYDNSLTLKNTYYVTVANTTGSPYAYPEWEYSYASRVSDGIGANSFYIRVYQISSAWRSNYKQFHAVVV